MAWAAAEALSLGAPIHLISALDLDAPAISGASAIALDSVAEGLESGTRTVLEEAAARLSSLAPGVGVSAQLVAGKAARALLDASATAAVVVLGSARAGALQQLLLGTTSISVVALAKCPVVVVGAQVPVGGDIVVAVDGSAHSAAALDYAFASAQRLGCGVQALAVWYVEIVDGVVATTPGSPQFEQVQAHYREMVDRVVAPRQAAYPQVPITVEVRRGSVPKVLVESAANARLLVLGTRGRGGIKGLLLGSVSRKVLNSATVPVAVLTATSTPR